MKQYSLRVLGIFIVFLLIVPFISHHQANAATPGNTYFVDASIGNDTNSGLSIQSAWKTISKVNTTSFLPGDKILFKKGEIWRESLVINSAGTASNKITFSSYGTGEMPIISGADQVTNLAVSQNNIWSADWQPEPNQLFIGNQRGYRKNSLNQLVNYRDWFYNENQEKLYIKGQANGTEPSTEASRREVIIDIYAPHVTIENLNVTKAGEYGIRAYKSGISIENNTVSNAFIVNIFATGWDLFSNLVIRGNQVYESGGTGIAITNNHRNTLISENSVYHNSRLYDTLVGGASEQRWSAGIKIWSENTPNWGAGTIIEKNDVFENRPYDWLPENGEEANRSVGIWVDETKIPTGENVHVRHNLIRDNDGIGLYLEKTQNVFGSYNIVHDNAKIRYTANLALHGNNGVGALDSGLYNNTVFGDGWWSVLLGDNFTSFTNNMFVNNLIAPTSSGNHIYIQGDIYLPANQNVIDYNYYVDNGRFEINADATTLSERFFSIDDWQSVSGQDQNSVFSTYPDPTQPLGENFVGFGLGNNFSTGLKPESNWPSQVTTTEQNELLWQVGAYLDEVTPNNSCPGDYNNDRYLSIDDLAIFAANYKQQNISCELDITGGDCSLTIADFSLFAQNYRDPNYCS